MGDSPFYERHLGNYSKTKLLYFGGQTMSKIAQDIARIVCLQLPASLRDKLIVEIQGDPYGIRLNATLTDERKRTWVANLEDMDFEGVPLRCKLPDTFVALLCVEV